VNNDEPTYFEPVPLPPERSASRVSATTRSGVLGPTGHLQIDTRTDQPKRRAWFVLGGVAIVLAVGMSAAAVVYFLDSGDSDLGNGASSDAATSTSDVGDRQSDEEAVVPVRLTLTGVSAGETLLPGTPIRLSVDGPEPESLQLLVDGVIEVESSADDGLVWITRPGDHDLVLRGEYGSSRVSSDPVRVSVAQPATTTTTTSTSTVAPRVIEALFPVSASASNERATVPSLRCGGSTSFEAGLLIDRNHNTGWGASSSDGTGQSITLDMGRVVHLSSIGLVPGYDRVAPRFAFDCQPTNAWDFNRLVASVRYSFDDGSSIVQAFGTQNDVYWTAIDVDTRTVRITILGTIHQGTDDDTILSEVYFEGWVP